MKWMLLEVFIAFGLAVGIVFWTLPKKPANKRDGNAGRGEGKGEV